MASYSTLLTNPIQPQFHYPQTIPISFTHLFIFSPNPHLILNLPSSFKLHILLPFTLFPSSPFTPLLHVSTVPLSYINTTYILYPKNKI
ncbi:respiratory nitrate reductase subunit gamma [Staphylococcus epidermidis]|uniref:respiratory nitrate reductase subunit gamma n=1 Tax=Staphylococcus epidermidis TaxID=1282 RepID=UPI0037D9C8C7